MANYARRGNGFDLEVARILRVADGALIGSRRHVGGAGDLLAIDPARGGRARVRLIECKTTAAGPYERFGPADRQAMIAEAELIGAEAWLAWRPPRRSIEWIPASRWP